MLLVAARVSRTAWRTRSKVRTSANVDAKDTRRFTEDFCFLDFCSSFCIETRKHTTGTHSDNFTACQRRQALWFKLWFGLQNSKALCDSFADHIVVVRSEHCPTCVGISSPSSSEIPSRPPMTLQLTNLVLQPNTKII